MLQIRKATVDDIPVLLELFERARLFMRQCGNMTQWADGYPALEDLERDIAKEQFYVAELDGVVHGGFAFIIGADPTYAYIDGEWLDDELAYGTIHRLVSSGEIARLADACIAYCGERISNLRIDTHADNLPMQRVALRNNFVHCGTIYLANGAPRLAYQRIDALGSDEQ